MDDSKLEEENNINRDENDDSKSKDITMTDVGVENEGLNNLQETQNLNNDISISNGEKKGNEVQSPVESVDTYEENESEQPAFSTLEKEGTLDPISVPIPENAEEIKSVSLDETQAEGEKINKSNEVELDQEIGKKEEEMNGKETSKELFTENERNGELLNSEVKLTEENKKGEEKMVSDSNGLEFNGDTEIKENSIENMESESELPPDYVVKEELSRTDMGNEELNENEIKKELPVDEMDEGDTTEIKSVNSSFLLGPDATEDDETGTIEEQLAFMKELEIFHKERYLDFRPPRFYQEPLNLLKLWRAVVRLGGYETVTSCKHWRQIGESFKPPKTCTTVSWTFRSFYEKALLEYEKHKLRCGELPYTDASFPDHIGASTPIQALGAGRQRRDAAARAMQGWHSRLHGNGDVGDTTIKDKCSTSTQKREKPLKSIGLLKRKMPSPVERVNVIRMKTSHPQSEADVIDIGHPANWVKINVQRTKDCFEVYALVPGLLREEVRVQSDAVGRLVISGEPDQLDNPWGVTPFRKVVSLPSRIDPHQTSAVVTLHGQLFVRVPFDPLDV